LWQARAALLFKSASIRWSESRTNSLFGVLAEVSQLNEHGSQ
jgi:hypothetical protein